MQVGSDCSCLLRAAYVAITVTDVSMDVRCCAKNIASVEMQTVFITVIE